MYAKPIRYKICIDFGVKAADGFGMFAANAELIFFLPPDDKISQAFV